MCYAATKYDPYQDNCKFISYAINWIRYYINEELRKMYPIRLNQNFVCKRNKVTRAIAKYQEENDGKTPTCDQLSAIIGMSPKVVKNILDVNGGNNFNYISFQSISNSNKTDDGDVEIETKLINEYLQEAESDYGMSSFEFKDMISALKKKIGLDDLNIFLDKHMNNFSISQLVKKYNLKPSVITSKIKTAEKTCKILIGEI
ncbi:MAG: hypothetical protein J6J11_09095 [Treponema sp.]|nr:hypothetical protein [Clostridia bacterium]MBP3608454.1 hypothetical protein [Treponema sp.]